MHTLHIAHGKHVIPAMRAVGCGCTLCLVDALTSVLSCNPLKKKIAHTATYFTVTSGSSGPVCRDRKRRGGGRVEEGERRGGRRGEEGWKKGRGGVRWSGVE